MRSLQKNSVTNELFASRMLLAWPVAMCLSRVLLDTHSDLVLIEKGRDVPALPVKYLHFGQPFGSPRFRPCSDLTLCISEHPTGRFPKGGYFIGGYSMGIHSIGGYSIGTELFHTELFYRKLFHVRSIP